MSLEQAKKMRHFINEYQYATGRHLQFQNLPDPGFLEMPEVRMTKESFVRFRNDFQLLLDFAAVKCNKPREEIYPLDLMAPFLNTEEPEDEEEWH